MTHAAEEYIKQCAGLLTGISVSGGSDSMCLLDLVLRSGHIDKSDILVINFDHGIRGEESARDSRFVADYCRERGLPLYFKKADIPSAARASGRSLETEARLFRRSQYDSLISSGRVEKIMLAHNLSDHTESVLMHIFRGSGLKGLIGPSASDGFIVRPLISAPKSDILEHIKRYDVPFVTDSTNGNSGYDRNYLRNEVLPLIRARWPAVDNAVSGLSDIAKDAYADGGMDIKTEGVSALIPDGDLTPRAVLEGFAAIGIGCDVTKKHIEAVLALKGKPCGSGTDVPHNGRAAREYGEVRLFKKNLPDGIDVMITDCEPMVEKGRLRFDPAKLPEYEIRRRRDGDMFTPCGGRRKLLSDYLTDKKIPKFVRDRLALIAAGSEVYAVCGVEISDKIKLDETSITAKEINVSTEEE